MNIDLILPEIELKLRQYYEGAIGLSWDENVNIMATCIDKLKCPALNISALAESMMQFAGISYNFFCFASLGYAPVTELEAAPLNAKLLESIRWSMQQKTVDLATSVLTGFDFIRKDDVTLLAAKHFTSGLMGMATVIAMRTLHYLSDDSFKGN